MHVYFLVIFHCLLNKEMEIYVTCILEVMEWFRLRYQNKVICHIKIISESLSLYYVSKMHCNLKLKGLHMCVYTLSFNGCWIFFCMTIRLINIHLKYHVFVWMVVLHRFVINRNIEEYLIKITFQYWCWFLSRRSLLLWMQ